jgi:secreted Zn-dependent insulinase-like peptidase
MPVVEKNFRASRQELINDISNDFPSFREMGNMIAASQRYGIHEDPNKGYAELFRKATMDDMIKYYETNLKNHAGHRVFGIVGNKKKLDLKALEKYGRVVILKEQDLFRK